MKFRNIVPKIHNTIALTFLSSAEKRYIKVVREDDPDSYFNIVKFYLEYGRFGHAMKYCLRACEIGEEWAEQARQILHRYLSSNYDTLESISGGDRLFGLWDLEDLLAKSSAIRDRARIDQRRTELLKKAEGGDQDAKFELGLFFAKGFETARTYIEPDYAEAIRWWREAGERGDARAQVNLAFMYATGRGIEKDETEAHVWWRKAAEAGHAGAQCELASIHEDRARALNDRSNRSDGDYWGFACGSEAQQEMSEAVRWMRRAGEQGDVDAQVWLGSVYGYAKNQSQSAPEAAKWYRMAAYQGDPPAQFALANIYAEGNGVSQNWPEATRWYFAAAEQGISTAQITLGHMYASGDVFPQSYDEAAKWYRLAAEHERRERYETYIGREYVCQPNYSAEGLSWLYGAAANGSRLAENVAERWCAEAKRMQSRYAEQSASGKVGWELDWDASPRPWLDAAPFSFRPYPV